MILTEETGKRIAVALEKLIILLEKAAHPPMIVIDSGPVDPDVIHMSDVRRGLRPCDDTEGR